MSSVLEVSHWLTAECEPIRIESSSGGLVWSTASLHPMQLEVVLGILVDLSA